MGRNSTFKRTFVCFNCMEVSRRGFIHYSMTECNCPKCGVHMIGLNYKMRVPKKKRKEWDVFKEWVRNYNPYFKNLIETQERKYNERIK